MKPWNMTMQELMPMPPAVRHEPGCECWEFSDWRIQTNKDDGSRYKWVGPRDYDLTEDMYHDSRNWKKISDIKNISGYEDLESET